MDFPTEATRRLSDEELKGALAQINRTIQGLEEHARGRDDPAQWGEPRVGEAILQGLYRRRCRREEIKRELRRREGAVALAGKIAGVSLSGGDDTAAFAGP